MAINTDEIKKIRKKLISEKGKKILTEQKKKKDKKQEKNNVKTEKINNEFESNIKEARKKSLGQEVEFIKRDLKEVKEILKDVVELSKFNLAYSKKSHNIAKKIKRSITWMRVSGFLKFFLIVTPIVLAYFYFLPFAEELLGKYREIYENFNSILQMK